MFARDPRTMPLLFLLIGCLLFAYGVHKQQQPSQWPDDFVEREIVNFQIKDDLYYAGTGKSISGVEDPSNRQARHDAIELSIRTDVENDAEKKSRSVKTLLLGGGFLILFMGFSVFNLWRRGEFKRDPAKG
ncbi:MAG: hypothetical protein ACI9HX_000587 [Pseudoalteromonas tetraodonis]|jgi:hypothetical protein